MSDIVEQLLKKVDATTRATLSQQEFLSLLQVEVSGAMEDSDLCDLGFLCREMESLLDELRKEYKAKKGLISKILAARVVSRAISSGDTETTVRGKYSTGSPSVKRTASPPKRGTPEYEDLCNFIGLSTEIVDHGFVSFHYVRLGDWLTSLEHSAEDLPPGIVKTHTEFNVTYRKKTRK